MTIQENSYDRVCTAYPEYSRYNTKYDNIDQPIKEDFDPYLIKYQHYLQENNLEQSKFANYLQTYLDTQLKCEDLRFVNYLQYLVDTKIIVSNMELYSHLLGVLEDFEFNGLIHKNRNKSYLDKLNNIYYAKNKKHRMQNAQDQNKTIDYSGFYDVTSQKTYNNPVINEIYHKGGEIYLNNKAKICLKLSRHSEMLPPLSKKDAETILSNEFGINIKITDDIANYDDINPDKLNIKVNTIKEIGYESK